MILKLRGKRTYILGATAALSAAASWAVGDIALPEMLRLIAEACIGLGLITLRVGVAATVPTPAALEYREDPSTMTLIEHLEALPDNAADSPALYQKGYLDAVADAIRLVKEHR
jgi:hypothetical protein